MKLGFNEATALKCQGQSLMADLEACEKNGFDYIEIRTDCLKAYLEEHSLDELKSWFDTHNLKPWAYNTLEFFNMRDEAGEKEIDEHVDFVIEVCNAIGMKTMIIVPTFDVGFVHMDEIHEEAVKRIRELADKVKPHGIRVSLEFCGVPTCTINQFGTAYKVVEAAKRDNVGITLDTFHFYAMGSKLEDLEQADPKRIFIYHVNDAENLPIGNMFDEHRLWPGEGAVPHEKISAVLNKIGFDGVATIEEFRPEYYEMSHEDNLRTSKEKIAAHVNKYFS